MATLVQRVIDLAVRIGQEIKQVKLDYAPKAAPTFTGLATIAGALKLSGSITPSAITTPQHNYNPTGFDGAAIIYQSTNQSAITGLSGGMEGSLKLFVNTHASNYMLFNHESTSSLAGNRFNLPGGTNLLVPAGGAVLFGYDSAASRWRALLISGPVMSVAGRVGAVTLATTDISGYVAPPTETSLAALRAAGSADPNYVSVRRVQGYLDYVTEVGTTGTRTFNFSTEGPNFYLAPNGNVTFANPTAAGWDGQSGIIIIANASYTFSWGTKWKFPSNVAPAGGTAGPWVITWTYVEALDQYMCTWWKVV